MSDELPERVIEVLDVQWIPQGGPQLNGSRLTLAHRIAYPTSHYSKGEAWAHLWENAPTIYFQGKPYHPFFEPQTNAPPGKDYLRNPYRKDHDSATWGWVVRQWVQGKPPPKVPKPPKPIPKTRYQLLDDEDWLGPGVQDPE